MRQKERDIRSKLKWVKWVAAKGRQKIQVLRKESRICKAANSLNHELEIVKIAHQERQSSREQLNQVSASLCTQEKQTDMTENKTAIIAGVTAFLDCLSIVITKMNVKIFASHKENNFHFFQLHSGLTTHLLFRITLLSSSK